MADNVENIADLVAQDDDVEVSTEGGPTEETPDVVSSVAGDPEDISVTESSEEVPVAVKSSEDATEVDAATDDVEAAEEKLESTADEAAVDETTTPADAEAAGDTEETPDSTNEPVGESTEESAPPQEEPASNPPAAEEKPKPEVAADVDMTQEITVYHSSISCSQQVKKQQQTVEFILTSKKYNVRFVDLACIGEKAKEEMRKIADDPKCLPPQIAKGEQYCGSYDKFMEAVEDGDLLRFLKLTQ